MRKLKTWEIVLLVIFYPVGICVLIYRLWKKSKLKREAEEAQRTAAEERERRAAADPAAQPGQRTHLPAPAEADPSGLRPAGGPRPGDGGGGPGGPGGAGDSDPGDSGGGAAPESVFS